MANLKNTIINDTAFIKIPQGSTANRPGNPNVGSVRFNTDYNIVEYYTGSVWKNTRQTIGVNTTGSVQTSQKGDYRVYAFTGSGQFLVQDFSGTIDVLVIAGGGGGGSHVGAGAGAGGYVYEEGIQVSDGDSFTVTVGAGGTQESNNTDGCGRYNCSCRATNGNDSTFDSITAIGGGRGGSWSFCNQEGGNGGSGGGEANSTEGSGTPGQGFDGGNPRVRMGGSSPYITGGGGGAGEQGFDNAPHAGQGFSDLTLLASFGGNGIYFGDKFGDLVGDRGWFSGGGGGGIHGSSASCGHVGVDASLGGLGGGGMGRCNGGRNNYASNGAPRGAQESLQGKPNTGGGGGGDGDSGNYDTRSGSGGSGIVLVRHRI